MSVIQAVQWTDNGGGGGGAVRILDQRELPAREVYRELRSVDDVRQAIATLAVRGAPAIGIAGALGVVLSLDGSEPDRACALAQVESAADRIRATRPTAVNLGWAVDRVTRAARACRTTSGTTPGAAIRTAILAAARCILDEDRAMCRALGEHGARLVPDGARVLTHCNTGALATGGLGTALACVYVAAEQGRRVQVFADETRPLLQGSRLTAWELERAGIPVTVLVDGAAASLMAAGRVDLCLVGADRIAANGDVANKIGTYHLAVAARHHGIPFYVAAPASTFDPRTATGVEIAIEQRPGEEIWRASGAPNAPAGVEIYNPAFDVTPASLITAIVSDRGVHRPPYAFGDWS